MHRTLALSVSLGASVLIAGCAIEHTTSMAAPSAAAATTGASSASAVSTPSLVGVWASNPLPTLPSPSTCGNLRYEIASQTATSIAGTFTAVCGGGLVAAGNLTGQLNGTSVLLTVTGTASMPGIPSCPFSITGTGSVEDGGKTLRIPYSGTTCLGPVNGAEVLRKPSPAAVTPAPAPAPTPTPGPTPAPAPGPTSNDAIDLRQVTVTSSSPADVANWPVTTTIRLLDLQANGPFVDFAKKDGPNRWPDVTPPGFEGGSLQYTLWMVENINGRWYTAGGIEFWYGLGRNGGPPSQYGRNWYYSEAVWGALANRQPAVGEQVGFFVTAGDARAKDVTLVRERSNVVIVPFPSDGGATYQF